MAVSLMAVGCSRQSRRGNFSFAVIHHWDRQWGGGRVWRRGRKDRVTPDNQRLASFKRLCMAYLGLVLILACKNTCIATERDSCTHPCTAHTLTHTQSSKYILAHVPATCLSLVVLFFSARGQQWKVFSAQPSLLRKEERERDEEG